METHVKIDILGTHPVTSANFKRKKYILLFIYLFSKIKTVGGRSFLTKTCTILITIHSLQFHTYHKFKFLSRFHNNYGFCNIPELGNNQQFKPKHMFIIIKNHNIYQLWAKSRFRTCCSCTTPVAYTQNNRQNKKARESNILFLTSE